MFLLNKKTWTPLEGTWLVEQECISEAQDCFAFESCLYLRNIPGKKTRKSYVLQKEGPRLLEALCAVNCERTLVKFLNRVGTLDEQEPTHNPELPYTTSMEKFGRSTLPFADRRVLDNQRINQLIRFAKTVRWTRRFVSVIHESEFEPKRLLEFMVVRPVSNKRDEKFVTAPVLRFTPQEDWELCDSFGKDFNDWWYEVPSRYKWDSPLNLLQQQRVFVVTTARRAAQNIMCCLLSDISATVGADFNLRFEPETPSQAICLALLEELSSAASIKYCECLRPTCPKIIKVGGSKGRYISTKYLTRECRQSVYDRKKRKQRLAEAKKLWLKEQNLRTV